VTNERLDEKEFRVEIIDAQQPEDQAQLLRFFRHLEAVSAYWEYVLPAAHAAVRSLALATVSFRPWPPFGIHGQRIRALAHFHPVYDRHAGFGGLYLHPGDAADLGMAVGLYKEALEQLLHQHVTEVNYVVRSDSKLVAPVLQQVGFEPTSDLVQSGKVRYTLFSADVASVLDALGLQGRSTSSLVELHPDDSIFGPNAIFQSIFQMAQSAWLRQPDVPGEWMPNLGGIWAGYEPGTP
jgi:hypothetical protein